MEACERRAGMLNFSTQQQALYRTSKFVWNKWRHAVWTDRVHLQFASMVWSVIIIDGPDSRTDRVQKSSEMRLPCGDADVDIKRRIALGKASKHVKCCQVAPWSKHNT